LALNPQKKILGSDEHLYGPIFAQDDFIAHAVSGRKWAYFIVGVIDVLNIFTDRLGSSMSGTLTANDNNLLQTRLVIRDVILCGNNH
jgi:hypothetical protein